MRLHPLGVEYYKLTIATDPATSTTDWEASFDSGETWTAATDVDGASAWLVAGHDAESPDPSAIVLPTSARPLVRLIDNPEVVVRRASSIIIG